LLFLNIKHQEKVNQCTNEKNKLNGDNINAK
jgi:hypothetical protein